MSIQGQHSYRFVFLRSERWKNIRTEALAKQRFKCLICNDSSYYNDGHHIVYQESVWDTNPHDIIILCRPCHNLVHALLGMPTSRSEYLPQMRNLVLLLHAWRIEKQAWWDGHAIAYRKLLTPFYKAITAPEERYKGECWICRKHKKTLNTYNPYFFVASGKTAARLKRGFVLCDDCLAALKAHFSGQPIPQEPWKALRAWIAEYRKQFSIPKIEVDNDLYE